MLKNLLHDIINGSDLRLHMRSKTSREEKQGQHEKQSPEPETNRMKPGNQS